MPVRLASISDPMPQGQLWDMFTFCHARIEDCSRCFQFLLIQTSISPAQPQHLWELMLKTISK